MLLLLRSRAAFVRPSSSRAKVSAAFLQLPPNYRAFHASPRPQFLETIATPAHLLFQGLHSFTGLPWVYTIPLTAMTIRLLISLPLSISQRRLQEKRRQLRPLVQAWHHQSQNESMKEVGHLGPEKTHAAFSKKARRKKIEILRRHGCGQLSLFRAPLIQLPVFMMSIEALRIMAGTKSGLLGLIARTIMGQEAMGLEERKGSLWFEPSLTTEGALWFKDLTVEDPKMMLPFILSGSMIINVLEGKKKMKGATAPTVWQKRFTRITLAMAIAAGPLVLHVPSGVLVYWISSMLMAFGQAILLNRFMPNKKQLTTCQPRRPVRGSSLAMKDVFI
ncbi:Mitochondrial inner membrane protein [Lachnellula hyalina]|uniref:Mitochondrial inner membrane protein n=1 Tax=Lachnellula hyalina TaxID=1316788 RepID=A0A8H8U2R1_9HELO|nr:Mitochondrial inner membrane protein [Lachnellula hyalina]TVY28361.1 Mitochondrial inner membrane protein [Lachnellula hyalina]